jgi:tRNA-dihydrouridine synthase
MPDLTTRVALVLEAYQDCLSFYGTRIGIRVFRKHLAAYVDQAPTSLDSATLKTARQELCRLEDPADVIAGLKALWRKPSEKLAA